MEERKENLTRRLDRVCDMDVGFAEKGCFFEGIVL
jgi:hypothetical protein